MATKSNDRDSKLTSLNVAMHFLVDDVDISKPDCLPVFLHNVIMDTDLEAVEQELIQAHYESRCRMAEKMKTYKPTKYEVELLFDDLMLAQATLLMYHRFRPK
jgi:hypothetical protein